MANAQKNDQDGRVKEVESFVSKKSLDFIRGRFPGMPVLINVEIDPLRMSGSNSAVGIPDNALPYLGFGNESQIDPWDDRSSSVHDLLTRIKALEIKVTLPNTVEDDLIFEVREALFSNLGMIKGRDRIEFIRKNWPGQEKIAIEYLIFAGLATILVLVSLFFITRDAFKDLRSTIKAAASEKSAAAAAAAAAPSAPLQADLSKNEKDSPNIQLNDSMKVAEKLESLIWKLSDDPAFPTLEDMMDLEKKAISEPNMLGALLKEMPSELQDKLFKRGKDPAWLEVFFSDGDLDLEAYHFVQDLTRRQRNEDEVYWQEFLISLWRLDGELTKFMRTLEQRDALGIFAWMPIEISLPSATAAFPGAWGILLKHDFKPPVIPEEATAKILEQALEERPYNDPEMLERYSHERGLIKYLKTCPLETEKDIYKAAKEGGSLRMVRPPFFEVLEADETILKELIPKIPIKDWGIALFNIDRGLRGAITAHMNDRERFVLIETLKECDIQGISPEDVGDTRESVARQYSEFLTEYKKIQAESEKRAAEAAATQDDQNNSQGNAA
jgi:hypothetical protein